MRIVVNKTLDGESLKRKTIKGTISLHILLSFILVPEVEGDTLELERISRLHMGAYLCIATNGVPPSVSKRIKVSVDCKYSNQSVC